MNTAATAVSSPLYMESIMLSKSCRDLLRLTAVTGQSEQTASTIPVSAGPGSSDAPTLAQPTGIVDSSKRRKET